MRKVILYLVSAFALLASCEEYYTPKLDEVAGMLVIESRLTNDPKQNFVKLSMARNFYDAQPGEKIVGATVDLIELKGTTTRGTEVESGYFTFNKIPVEGRTYQLKVAYKKDIFESELMVMPPVPKIDTLYTAHILKKLYYTDSYGVPELKELPRREIYVDAPITSKLSYYRFNWRAVILWQYDAPALNGPPPPTVYGWNSFYDGDSYNLAGPKEFSSSDKVRKHPILALSYDGKIYLDSASLQPTGWIIMIDQYGIPKRSYDYHETLNKQFEAEGSLFDPVLTQVYGNIHCKTDPEKIALGFFELASYRQYRYYFYFGTGPDNQVIQRRLNRYPDIPDNGFTRGIRPIFWERNFE